MTHTVQDLDRLRDDLEAGLYNGDEWVTHAAKSADETEATTISQLWAEDAAVVVAHVLGRATDHELAHDCTEDDRHRSGRSLSATLHDGESWVLAFLGDIDGGTWRGWSLYKSDGHLVVIVGRADDMCRTTTCDSN